MTLIAAAIFGIKAYAAAGGVLASLFLTIGIDRIDPAARGSIAFRVLLIPGLVLLWPIVLARWVQLHWQDLSQGH